jgi:hypothetical protein
VCTKRLYSLQKNGCPGTEGRAVGILRFVSNRCKNVVCTERVNCSFYKLSAKEHMMKGQEIISEPTGDGSACLPVFGRTSDAGDSAAVRLRDTSYVTQFFPFLVINIRENKLQSTHPFSLVK